MGWEAISVADVEVIDEKAPVPAGPYSLQLMGAFENKRNPLDTDILFKIADDGNYKGKSIYVDLPDPDRLSWSPQIYARIVKALGATVEPYKNPREVLNELAKNGHSRLGADVYIRTFTRQDGSEGQQNKVATKSFRAAA
jgi:hypothetical protein